MPPPAPDEDPRRAPGAPARGAGGPAGALPRVGALLGGHVLEGALGQGAMGAVFVGRHATLGTRRAIKVLLDRAGDDARERFEREARALAKVDRHPGIVDIHASGVEGGLAYLVLELIEGSDLERELAAGPLPVARAVALGAGVADALAHLHARGIVHRDLKPANVLVRRDGSPVLTDLGVARDEGEARLTRSNALLGSPLYMAPEQLGGDRRRVGPPTDVWALGVLLFRTLTGEHPFDGESLPALVSAIGSAPPPRLRGLRPDAPAALAEVVEAALEKDPALRPTAVEVRDALRALAAGRAVDLPSRSGAGWRRLPRRARRGLAAGALVGLLGLGLAVGVEAGWRRPRARARAALAAEEAWAREVLAPWAVGTAGDAPCPAGPAELAARAARVEAARGALGADVAARADALAARLRVHARLAEALARGGDAAAPPGAPRAALDLLAEGVALARRGDARAALARVELATARDPELAPARVLELRLRADLDPRGFLARAQAAAEPARAEARRVAPRALLALQADVLRAAREGGRDDARQALERLAAVAADLGVDLAPLGPAKVAALEADAAAWGALLQDALGRGAERDALLRLVGALAAPPEARPGPRLRAALSGVVAPLLAAHDQAQDDLEASRRMRRAVAAEAVVAAALGPGQPPDPAFARRVERHLTLRLETSAEAAVDLALAGLRVGTALAPQTFVRGLDPAALAQRAQLRPRSRAVRFALLVHGRPTRGREAATPGGVARLLATCDEVAAAGLDDDLAPPYLGDLYALRSGLRHELALRDPSPARWEGVLEDARKAAALCQFADDVGACRERELAALDHLVGRAEATRALERLVEEHAERGRAAGGPSAHDEVHARLLRLLAGWRLAAGRAEEALRLADEAIAAQATTLPGDRLDGHVVRAGALRALGRIAEARDALGDPPDGLDRWGWVHEAALVTAASGDEARALALVEEARRRHPNLAANVAELAAQVERALADARAGAR